MEALREALSRLKAPCARSTLAPPADSDRLGSSGHSGKPQWRAAGQDEPSPSQRIDSASCDPCGNGRHSPRSLLHRDGRPYPVPAGP